MRGSLFVGCLAAFAVAMPASADEAAVKKMIGDYADAFNSKQLETVIGFWTENGVHIDRETGERTEGREAIRADIASAFQARPSNRIFGRIESVRFIKPDVATADGSVTISSPDADPIETSFSAVLVEQGGKWMIDSLEEVPRSLPQSGSEALADLDWLVGRWLDETDDARVDTVFRWSSNGNFLLRSYSITDAEGATSEGTQVIGWDPRSGEIRSWSFNSDGSFGDATWSKSGDEWLIKTSQTLADGQAASGTFVMSRNGDNEISLKLIGHDIEGVPQPVGEPVTAVRVAEDNTTNSPAQPE